MVMPAEGPSFGIAPAGTCMWMSFFSNKSSGYGELRRLAPYVAQRSLGRFLHHVAELTGQDEVPFTLHFGRFDENYVSARGVQARPVATPEYFVLSATSE